MAAHDALPSRNPQLVVVAVDDAWVAYDPVRRQAHLLNLTAGLVLDACDGETTEGAVTAELAAAFAIETTLVARQVAAALTDFGERGLLRGSPDETISAIDEPRLADPTTAPTPAGDRTWAVQPPTLDLLGTAVQIRIEEPGLAAVATGVLASLIDTCATNRAPSIHLDLVTNDETVILLRDDRALLQTGDRSLALQRLLGELNQQAVGGTTDTVLLHAAAVRGPKGIAVLPADSNSGKSTLAAALVRAGYDYLTDEAVGIDVHSGAVRVYPRAVGLGPGSWPLFPDVAPTAAETDAGYFAEEWHVDPRRLRAGALDHLDQLDEVGEVGGVPIVVVAFPTYEPDEPSRIEPVERATALLVVLHNAFNLAAVGEPGVRALDDLTHHTATVRLVSRDLDEAVALLTPWLGPSTVSGQ